MYGCEGFETRAADSKLIQFKFLYTEMFVTVDQTWLCNSVWLEYLPVTEEAEGSNPFIVA